MKPTLALALGLAAGCALGISAIAQSAAELDVELYAGVTVAGTVGTVYSIEYATDLAQTNSPTAWRCLEFLQLPASPYLWTDKSAHVASRRFYRAVPMEAPTNMVFIPQGTFRMGSPTNEIDRAGVEGPQTSVVISRGFWLGKHEVTQGDYEAVLGNNPSYFNGDHTQQGGVDYGSNPNRPVERVSWSDATNYCAALTRARSPEGRIPFGSAYRLPTEAEWEYACRAWTSTRFSYGDDIGYMALDDYAWHGDNSDAQTHPVGQKLPNPWGLYDMHGNVYEWCLDGWSSQLADGVVVDPMNGMEGIHVRVVRGGSWFGDLSDERVLRSAARAGSPPSEMFSDFGFRVVLSPDRP